MLDVPNTRRVRELQARQSAAKVHDHNFSPNVYLRADAWLRRACARRWLSAACSLRSALRWRSRRASSCCSSMQKLLASLRIVTLGAFSELSRSGMYWRSVSNALRRSTRRCRSIVLCMVRLPDLSSLSLELRAALLHELRLRDEEEVSFLLIRERLGPRLGIGVSSDEEELSDELPDEDEEGGVDIALLRRLPPEEC